MSEDKKISRRKYLKYAGAGIVAVAVAAAGGYYATRPGPGPAPTETATQTGTATTAEKKEVINIAGFHPATGPGAAFGLPWMQAEQLAVKQINAKGLKGFSKINYTFYDDETSAATATRKFLRMVQSEPADFVVAGGLESIDKNVDRLGAENGYPVMTGTEAGDILYGDIPLNSYYFAHDTTNIDEGLAAGETMQKLGAKKVATIAADYDYGYLIYAGLNAYNALNGQPFDLVKPIFTPLDKTDYSSEIAKIKDAKPDALLCIYTGAGFLSLPKQLVLAKAKPGIVFFDEGYGDLATAKLCGVEGMTGAYNTISSTDPTSDVWKKFVEAWRNEYGPDSYPTIMSEGCYQSVWAIKAAFEEAGTKDREVVKEVLRKSKWCGEEGALQPAACCAGPFSEWGQNLSASKLIVQWREGASDLMPDFNLHQEVVGKYDMKYTFPEYKEMGRKYVPPEVTW